MDEGFDFEESLEEQQFTPATEAQVLFQGLKGRTPLPLLSYQLFAGVADIATATSEFLERATATATAAAAANLSTSPGAAAAAAKSATATPTSAAAAAAAQSPTPVSTAAAVTATAIPTAAAAAAAAAAAYQLASNSARLPQCFRC